MLYFCSSNAADGGSQSDATLGDGLTVFGNALNRCISFLALHFTQ